MWVTPLKTIHSIKGMAIHRNIKKIKDVVLKVFN